MPLAATGGYEPQGWGPKRHQGDGHGLPTWVHAHDPSERDELYRGHSDAAFIHGFTAPVAMAADTQVMVAGTATNQATDRNPL